VCFAKNSFTSSPLEKEMVSRLGSAAVAEIAAWIREVKDSPSAITSRRTISVEIVIGFGSTPSALNSKPFQLPLDPGAVPNIIAVFSLLPVIYSRLSFGWKLAAIAVIPPIVETARPYPRMDAVGISNSAMKSCFISVRMAGHVDEMLRSSSSVGASGMRISPEVCTIEVEVGAPEGVEEIV